MTRVRRLAVFFVASVLLFSVMILPVYAKADININTFSDEQLYDYLMEKTKNDFLIAISEICKESVPAQIGFITQDDTFHFNQLNYACSERSVFS